MKPNASESESEIAERKAFATRTLRMNDDAPARANVGVVRAPSSAGEGDTATESSSDSDSDDDSSEDSSDSDSSSESKGKVKRRGKGGANGDSQEKYAVQGRLPAREKKSEEAEATFMARCYDESAKFCGLGALLEDKPSESSSESSSESEEKEKKKKKKKDTSKKKKLKRYDTVVVNAAKNGSDNDSGMEIDDKTISALKAEEEEDLWPSPTLVEREFENMKRRLQRKRDRDEMKLEEIEGNYEKIVGKRGKSRPLPARIHSVVVSMPFLVFMAICIVYSAVVSGIVAAEPAKFSGSDFEDISFIVLNIIFALEVVVKLASSGITIEKDGVSHLVVWKPHYYFADFVNCFDFVVTILAFLEYVPGLRALNAVRNLRLIRLLRLLKLVEDMRIILEGVIQGILSIIWILILLSVVVYIYAVFGVILFKDNDPRNFRSLGAASMTVISVCTMSDWIDFFYINYYGCAEYGYHSALDSDYCTASKAMPWVTTTYMVTMILILGNIMMSLFIGVITNKMEEAAMNVKEGKDKTAARNEEAIANDLWGDVDMLPVKLGAETYEQLMYHLNLLSGVRREGETRPLPKLPLWRRAQIHLQHFVHHPAFEYSVLVVIITAGVMSGVTANKDGNAQWLKISELVFLSIFASELVIKFIAALDKKLSFYTGPEKWWNIFDTFVVLFGLIPNTLNGIATAVRLFRLLRVLRLVRIVKPLQVVVISLVAGLSAIAYVALMMLLVFFVYAVAGVTLFAANDPFHFGSLGTAGVTLFTVSFLEHWRAVYDVNYFGCDVNAFGDNDGGLYYADLIGSSYNGTSNSLVPNPCVAPNAQEFTTFGFFSTFILISAMVLVSALVGIIVTSMQNAQEIVRVRMDMERRSNETSEYFKFKEQSIEHTIKVFRLLDAGFVGELTPQVMLEKMKLLGVPTNPAFLQRAYATANKMTDKPFDRADFLLLVGLAERAVMLQDQFEAENDGEKDDDQSDQSSLSGARVALGVPAGK